MKPMKAQATIEGISTRKDRTLKIVIGTQEISPEDKASLFNLVDNLGWFVFAPFENQDVEIPPEPKEKSDGRKSQSERLRACQYVLWEKSKSQLSFEDYRLREMERLIDWYKERIGKYEQNS